MSFRTVLVHLPDVDRATALLESALTLVSSTEGHLIGLHVSPPILLKLGQVFTADLEGVAREERRRREDTEKIRTIFDEMTQRATLVAEWRHVEAKDEPTISGAAIGMGRAVDLIVAGRSRPDDQFALRELPARLALECGRPVLIVPPEWSRGLAPKCVVIAWNGSKEASRATFDAVPLLSGAKRVEIVTAVRDSEGDEGSLAGEPIAAALSRHGIRCDVAALSASSAGEGAVILERVKSARADLLVMGAYGRPRFAELVLGGVTQTVLRESPLPVLLSH